MLYAAKGNIDVDFATAYKYYNSVNAWNFHDRTNQLDNESA